MKKLIIGSLSLLTAFTLTFGAFSAQDIQGNPNIKPLTHGHTG